MKDQKSLDDGTTVIACGGAKVTDLNWSFVRAVDGEIFGWLQRRDRRRERRRQRRHRNAARPGAASDADDRTPARDQHGWSSALRFLDRRQH